MIIVSKVFDFADGKDIEMGKNLLKGIDIGETLDSKGNVIGKNIKCWLQGTAIMSEDEITEEWAVDIMINNAIQVKPFDL